jgi:fibronectin-binding autotransporter adhesin
MKTKTSILQNPLTAKSWRSCLQLLVALALLGWSAMAHAAPQADTWTGLGADNNWGTAANWNPAITTSGDALTFAVSLRPAPTNNFTGLQIDSITFSTNGYALSGNALTITNGITDSTGSNSCSIPLTLGASQTFQNNAGGATNAQTTQSGTINLGPNNLTIAGNGNFYLNGIVSSTNGGTLTVNSGIARLGPSTGSTPNTFGSNTVVFTITSTNTTYSTNITYITNSLVLITNGVSTNVYYTYITNTVFTTNNLYTYVTNGIFSVLDAVTVNSGTLQFGGTVSGVHIPNGASVGNVLLNGTLDLNGVSDTINGLEGSGYVDNIAAANTGIYTLTLGNASSNAVFSGIIQNTAGTVALTKIGYGTQTLSGGNQYSGPTIINQGTLVVGASGSLGQNSPTLTIGSGAVLDVSAVSGGYYPYVGGGTGPIGITVSAGTPTKPYTNFLGSYSVGYPATPAFVVTTTTNNTINTTTNVTFDGSVYTTNLTYVTNFASYAYSSNSIVSIVNADVIGDFVVPGGGAISPITSISPGIATWTINGNLSLDSSRTLPTVSPNRVNFLLNNTTTPGGGTNDLIVVNGTLYIGDELDFVITPLTGTLVAGTYILIESTTYVPNGNPANGYSDAANLKVIEPRGLNDTVSASGNNIILTSSGGLASPGSIIWAATTAANDIWNVGLTQNWKTNAIPANPDYYYSLDNVVFDDSGFGTVTLPVVQSPSSMTFNNSKTNYAFTANNATFITGPGGLTLNGSGTVTLNNPNSFTGDVTINNGTLILGNYGGYGNVILYNGVAPGQLVMGGNSIFEINAALASVSSAASFAGITLQPGANAQMFYPGRGSSDTPWTTIGANINRSVGSSLYMNIALRANSGQTGVYFTNTIPWTNGLLGGGWAHTGSDWLAAATNFPGNSPVSGNYNYTGYSNNTALATWVATNNISVSNSTASVTASATINTLKLSGPATVTTSSGQTLTIQTGGLLVSSAGTGPSTITGGTLKGAAGADLIVLQNLTGSGNPLTIGSVIADNGSATALTLGGLGGTLILTNNNTYTGATYINAGSLQVGAGAALGSIATSSSIIDNGGTLSFNRPDSTSVGSVSGTGGITQLGTGTLTLTANNTLRGVVTISAGTLQVGNGGAAGSISNITSVVDSGTLVFNNNGTLGYGGVISGIGRVVQNGSGTLILQTNETYSGNTIVSNGAVVLTASGSISNTAAIVVNAGAVFDASAAGGLTLRSAAPSEILAGGGTIKGTVTVATGTKIAPGTNGVIGTLTFNNNLNLNGGNLVFDVTNSPGASDQILVAGVLNQTSGNVLVNVKGTQLANGLYPLVYATNGLNGTSANNLIAIGFLQTGQLAVLTNSTLNELDLLVYTGVAPSLTWQGDSSLNLWDTTASSIWQGAALYQQGDYVTFDDSGSASLAVNLDIVEYPAAITVNSTTKNYTFGVNGGSGVNRISGGASLVKNGSGTLTLQTINDYSGSTTINGGVIQLNGAGTASAADGMIGSGSVVNNGTLIANNYTNETIAGNISGSGLLVQQGVGTLILAGNNTAFAGPITSTSLLQVGNGVTGTLGTGNVTNNGSLLFNTAGAAVNANISGSGNVTNLGGSVTLNGTDTYAGNTAIPGGKIVLGSANALPNTTTVIMNDSGLGAGTAGVLDLNGYSPVIPNLGGTNTGAGTASFAPSQILNNNSGTTSTLTISGTNTTIFYGQITDNSSGSGKVALAVRDGATLRLSPVANNLGNAGLTPNTYSGGLTVSNATVIFGTDSGSGTFANMDSYAAGGNPVGTQNVTLQGTNGTVRSSSNGGSNDGSSPTLGIVNVATNQTGWIYGTARSTFTCTLQGGGTLNYFGNSTVNRGNIGGDWSAFTGTLALNGLAIGFNNTLGLPLAAVVVTTNHSAGMAIYSRTANAALPWGSLSGGDNGTLLASGPSSGGNGGQNCNFVIGSLGTITSPVNTTFGGQIVDPGTGLRKVGYGTLTLTNNVLSYGGQTVVSNGTLAFVPLGNNPGAFNALTNNYLIGTNFTLVAPGIMDVSAAGGTLYLTSRGTNPPAVFYAQTLFGSGTLNGSLVVSNNLVAPARRAGDTNIYTGSGLTVNNSVKLGFGSSVLLTINRTNSPANDRLTAASIVYGGALVVTNLGDTAYANGSSNVFRLFNITGNTISGTFTNITLPVLPANELWVTNLSLDGSIALVNTSPSINMNPPAMEVSFNGTQLTLGWPTNLGWILQSQTNTLGVGLTTPSNTWFDVAGSVAQTNAVITINPTNPTVFYRLRLP